MTDSPSTRNPEVLEQLETTLEAAIALVSELATDDLLRRLIAAFKAMPTEDRPVIIGILEREVLGRLLSRGTEKPVGQSTHVNPNARLYVRAHESDFDRRLFDRDGMMIADIRAMRIACIVRNIPEIHSLWKEAMREALDHVDEATWQVAEDLLRDVLDCINDARTSGPVVTANAPNPTTPTPAPPDPPDADAGTDGGKRSKRS
jgi:hypothetical protein